MKSLGMSVCILSLAAMLAACGDGLVVSLEGVEFDVTPSRAPTESFDDYDEWAAPAPPTPQVGFDRPPPSSVCPDGTMVLYIYDCPLPTAFSGLDT